MKENTKVIPSPKKEVGILREHGLIATIADELGKARYTANLTPHIHFECMICRRIYDIPNYPTMTLPSEFRVTEPPIAIVRGICPSCQES